MTAVSRRPATNALWGSGGRFGRARPWLLRLVAALLAANMLRGIFPLASAEGDDQYLINGVNRLLDDPTAAKDVLYAYPFQPGTSDLLLVLHRMTGWPVATSYYALSAGAAVLAAVAGALLARRLLGLSWAASLVLMLLAQEIPTAAFYANSSTFGGLMGLLALLVVARAPRWPAALGAGLLLGVGGWFRLDSLVLAPAVLPILARERGLHRSVALTALAAAASVGALSVLWAYSGVTLRQVFGAYAAADAPLGAWVTFRDGFLVTSYGGTILSALGVAWAVRNRALWLAALVLAVLLPELGLYGRYFWSTKYFYYLAPILAIASGYAWKEAWEHGQAPGWRWKAAVALGALAVATEQLTGARTSSPAYRRFEPSPTVATIASITAHGRPMAWVVGPGELIPTADAFRIRTGIGFSGLVWSREKRGLLEALPRIQSFLARHPRAVIFTCTYLSTQCVEGQLIAGGYRFQSSVRSTVAATSRLDLWVRGAAECAVAWINEGDFAAFRAYRDQAADSDMLFVNDMGRVYGRTLTEGDDRWVLRSGNADGLIAVYERPGVGSPP